MKEKPIQKTIATSLLVLGMVLLLGGTTEVLEGEEDLSTGQGSTVSTWVEEEAKEGPQSELRHGAALKGEDISFVRAVNIILGIVLVILGFTLHAIVVSRSREVPVHLRRHLPQWKRRRPCRYYYHRVDIIR